MSVGWGCLLLAEGGDVQLEQLDAAGRDWYGEGPGGVGAGSLREVVATVAAPDADPEWIEAVVAAVGRELLVGLRRSMLVVKRGQGRMFHASRSANRESIRRHGLDWRRMGEVPGIAGDREPDWPGNSSAPRSRARVGSPACTAPARPTSGARAWTASGSKAPRMPTAAGTRTG